MPTHKSRATKRSGVLRRRQTSEPFATWDDWIAANNATWTREHLEPIAERFLQSWERQAFKIYEAHGLPTEHHCWRTSAADAWQGYSTHPQGGPQRGEAFSVVSLVGKEIAEPDSDLGFATAILDRVYNTRRELRASQDALPWRMFIQAASIAQDSECLHIEFGLASWLGPGRVQAEARERGGHARAAIALGRWRNRHATWQAALGKLDRNLSLRASARLIARKFQGTEFAASESTIRRALAKVAHEHTT